MSSPLDSFLSTLTLVCRVRIPYRKEPDYSRVDFWLPVIGILAGLAALGGWGLGTLLFRSAWLRALCALVVQYLAFNLFHLDGLADTADAGLALASPERRHEILKDSRVGTYGLFAAVLALIARTAALADLGGRPGFATILLAAPVAGRFGAVLVPLIAKPARTEGLGARMKDMVPMRTAAGLLIGLAPAFLAALFGFADEGNAMMGILASGIGALVAGLLVGVGTAVFYRRRFGGFTGDALGAAIELGELAFLLGACALTGGAT